MIILDSMSVESACIVFTAILTVSASYLCTRHLENKKIKTEATVSFIKEFYSAEFIVHRKVLSNLHKKVIARETDSSKRYAPRQDPSIELIAEGFVYPIKDESNSYIGQEKEGLTEHNHLTMYLSFLQRLAISIDNNQVYLESIKKGISDAMIWHAELSLAVCYKIEELADRQPLEKGKDVQGRIELIKRPAKMVIDLHEKLDLTIDKLEAKIIKLPENSYDIPEIPYGWMN